MGALVALGPEKLPRLQEINVDGRVLVFTVAVSLLTGLVFGIAPALHASKPELQQTLKEGGTATRGRHWLRNLLVVGEVAVAMILLVGAGLMLNSFLRLQRVNPVINTGNLLSVKINLPKTRYSDSTMAARFFQELIHKVEVLPGVNSTSLSTVQPLSEVATNDPFVIEQARFIADRARQGGTPGEKAIEFAFRLVLGRSPSPEELRWSHDFLEEHRRLLAEEHTPADLAALQAFGSLCQLLLNTSEFLYLN